MHRDVKAANILLQEDGSAALTDFGLAKGTGYEGLTAVGQIVGTIEYLAPERITGQEAAPASDLYALGCVIYETLVGKTPFAGKGPMGTAFGHLEEVPPDPCGVREDVSPAFAARRPHRARQGSRRAPGHRARLRRRPAGRAVWLTGGCRGSSRGNGSRKDHPFGGCADPHNPLRCPCGRGVRSPYARKEFAPMSRPLW